MGRRLELLTLALLLQAIFVAGSRMHVVGERLTLAGATGGVAPFAMARAAAARASVSALPPILLPPLPGRSVVISMDKKGKPSER